MAAEARSRRQFLTALSMGVAVLAVPGERVSALNLLDGRGDHPDPRPGIDGGDGTHLR